MLGEIGLACLVEEGLHVLDGEGSTRDERVRRLVGFSVSLKRGLALTFILSP